MEKATYILQKNARLAVWSIRSSRPELFYKKGVLRNFARFTGKHLCWSLFFNKVAGLKPPTLLKKRLWHRCFPVNFAKFLRTPLYRTPLDDCFWSMLTKYNHILVQNSPKYRWGIFLSAFLSHIYDG